jgi:hypothetical protein
LRVIPFASVDPGWLFSLIFDQKNSEEFGLGPRNLSIVGTGVSEITANTLADRRCKSRGNSQSLHIAPPQSSIQTITIPSDCG